MLSEFFHEQEHDSSGNLKRYLIKVRKVLCGKYKKMPEMIKKPAKGIE